MYSEESGGRGMSERMERRGRQWINSSGILETAPGSEEEMIPMLNESETHRGIQFEKPGIIYDELCPFDGCVPDLG